MLLSVNYVPEFCIGILVVLSVDSQFIHDDVISTTTPIQNLHANSNNAALLNSNGASIFKNSTRAVATKDNVKNISPLKSSKKPVEAHSMFPTVQSTTTNPETTTTAKHATSTKKAPKTTSSTTKTTTSSTLSIAKTTTTASPSSETSTTTSTAPPATKLATATSTAPPSSKTTTTTTARPSSKTKTSTTSPPSSKTTTTTTASPSSKTKTTTTAPPSSKTTTTTTAPPSSKTTTATTAPPSSKTTTTTTAPPSSKTTTTTTAPPSSKTTTTTTAPPSSKTKTATTAPPSSKTTTTTTAPPSSKTTTTTTAPPSSKTTTTTTAPPSSKTTTTTTAPPSTTTKIITSSALSSTKGTITTAPSSSARPTTTSSTSTPESTTPQIVQLVVKIVGNTEVQLPNGSVVLHAKVDDTAQQAADFNYKWTLISHPVDHQGEATTHGNSLTLETLTAGRYQYQVQVSDVHAYGEAAVNITVKEPKRINTPPFAVISPKHQEITLPHDNTILDAAGSTDDDGIATYLWEMTSRPLQVDNEPWTDNTQPALELQGLVVGDYEFKLTVTDTDGVSNSTTATVTVNKKVDHKPTADAGSNILIHLPQNSVVLYANNSRDDYGIVSYKWVFNADGTNQVVDMQGTRTSELHLSNLEAGQYKFRLTVADESGQEDSADVMVNVQPASNHPPEANAGQDKQVFLPIDGSDLSIGLDGSNSRDDKDIKTVKWSQKNGPAETTIAKPNSLTTPVSGLNTPGNYVFVLTVGDEEGESSRDDVTIIVNEVQPPVADAGPDVTLTAPDDVIVLDGRKSHDEYGIKSYAWERDPASPASGRVVNGSDASSRFLVEGLTEGTYKFSLTVINIRGKCASDDVTVKVLPNPHAKNLVELHLGVHARDFTEGTKRIIAKQIPLLLSLPDDEKVFIESVRPKHGNGHLILSFYVEKSDGKCMDAIDVVTLLNAKLQSGVPLFDVDVVMVDTFVCENNCSGHGICHSASKLCECGTFWMQNFIRFYAGDGASNCDWSVLYFTIVCFILIVLLAALCYGAFLLCMRRRGRSKRIRRKRKHYTPLVNGSSEKLALKPTKNGLLKKNGFRKSTNTYRSNQLLTSSSDEDETLYEKQKLLKPGRKKTRSKNIAPLIDMESEPARSGDEFDGTGLDKTTVVLRGRGSSAEDII